MMDIVEKARKLACKWHEGQLYGGLPYVCHLRQVVNSLEDKFEKEVDPVLIASAWLHDILEDTECTGEDIEDACGEQVLEAVCALTKWPEKSYEEYISNLKKFPVALEVKLHDTLCNLTASVMSGNRGRIRKYSKQMQLLVED